MKNGFTLIELIISIFVMSVAVVGVYSAFSMVSVLTADTTDRLTATYLAQEGMEIVRNIRDTNWLNMDKERCFSGNDDPPCPVSWFDGLSSSSVSNSVDCSTSGCGADYKSVIMNPNFSDRNLCINSSGFYSYDLASSCTDTKFRRKIIIESISDAKGNSDYIVKVTVQVSWNKKATILDLDGGVDASQCQLSNCIKAEATLYDWYNHNYH